MISSLPPSNFVATPTIAEIPQTSPPSAHEPQPQVQPVSVSLDSLTSSSSSPIPVSLIVLPPSSSFPSSGSLFHRSSSFSPRVSSFCRCRIFSPLLFSLPLLLFCLSLFLPLWLTASRSIQDKQNYYYKGIQIGFYEICQSERSNLTQWSSNKECESTSGLESQEPMKELMRQGQTIGTCIISLTSLALIISLFVSIISCFIPRKCSKVWSFLSGFPVFLMLSAICLGMKCFFLASSLESAFHSSELSLPYSAYTRASCYGLMASAIALSTVCLVVQLKISGQFYQEYKFNQEVERMRRMQGNQITAVIR
jgi:hypothetical protein